MAIKAGYSISDTRTPRRIVSRDDDAVDWDGTPEHAQKAYQESGDCSGLVFKGEPTWFTWRVAKCTEAAATLQLAGFQGVPQKIYAARLVLDWPGYEWTDEKGKDQKGLPREEEGGLYFVADDWLKQNLWEKHQAFLYTVGRLALAVGPTDLEKKA